MRLVETRGSPEQRGVRQGEAFASVMPDAYQAMASMFTPGWVPGVVSRGLVRSAMAYLGRKYLRRDRTVLTGHDASFLDGLASGLGRSREMVYGVNAIEVESAIIGYRMGCTSLGLDSTRTASGRARLVYNHDFMAAFQPFLFLRRNVPANGYRSLGMTYPTLVGAICGVNERGLAASYNQGYATDFDKRIPATLVSLLLQRCLDTCASADEAVALVENAQPASGALMTFVDDRGGRAAIELSGSAKGVRGADTGELLYSFNKYRVAAMHAHEIPVGAVTTGFAPGLDIHGCNVTRQRRLLELDRSQVFDDSALLAIMADHDGGDGGPLSICRHDDSVGGSTIFTAIVNPAERSMLALSGHPCEVAPQRYVLDEESTTEPQGVGAPGTCFI